MFSSFGQQLLNIIAPLPEDEEPTAEPREYADSGGAESNRCDRGRGEEALEELSLEEVSLDDAAEVVEEVASDPIQSALGIFRKASALLATSIPTLPEDSFADGDEPQDDLDASGENLNYNLPYDGAVALSEGGLSGMKEIGAAESDFINKSAVEPDIPRDATDDDVASNAIVATIAGIAPEIPHSNFESPDSALIAPEGLGGQTLQPQSDTHVQVAPCIDESARAVFVKDTNTPPLDMLQLHEKAVADLLDCERRLKEAEDAAWMARAEASELLFALESERKVSEDVHRRLVTLEEAYAAADAKLNDVQQQHTNCAAHLPAAFQRLSKLSGLSADVEVDMLAETMERLLKETMRERDFALEAKETKSEECTSLQLQLSSCRDEVESMKELNANLQQELQCLQADLTAGEIESSKLVPQKSKLLSSDEGDNALKIDKLMAELQRLEKHDSDAQERLEKTHLEIELLSSELCLSKRDLETALEKLRYFEVEVSERDRTIDLVTKKCSKLQSDNAEQEIILTQLRQQLNKYV